MIGYESQEVPVGDDDRVPDIILKEASQQVDEVVVVAFGTQKKESVIASITTVNPSDLRVPSSNLTTSFAGRIAGMISSQRNGDTGHDNAHFFIRGVPTFGPGKGAPLWLLDHV